MLDLLWQNELRDVYQVLVGRSAPTSATRKALRSKLAAAGFGVSDVRSLVVEKLSNAQRLEDWKLAQKRRTHLTETVIQRDSPLLASPNRCLSIKAEICSAPAGINIGSEGRDFPVVT